MTDDDIAEGWYTDSEGAIRWWDGTRWTEHVRTESGDPEATAILPADDSEPAGRRVLRDEDPGDSEHDHRRRVWLTATFVGLLAFFLGMAIGGNGDTPDPVVEEATASSGATVEELDRREAELDSRQGDLDIKQEELDRREANLETRENDLRQDASGEGSDTIGNGVFEVGEDVRPGRYVSDGPDDPVLPCTYRVSEDEDGDEIISSEVSDGPGIVSLEDDQYFTSEYCQTWTWQGP